MIKRTSYMVTAILAVTAAFAQLDPAPGTMDYQSTLLQSDGVTPETGPVDLEFRLYAAESGGAALWGEVHADVVLVDGVFAVELGCGAPIDAVPRPALETVFDGAPLWLGITVAGEAERVERQQFTSAPYALTANTAITAVHGVPPGTIAVWVGEDPPVGWLACDGESYARTGEYARLFAAIGTTWGEGDEPGAAFNVPNMGGRTPIGAMAAGHGQNDNSPGAAPATAGLTDHALGDLLGEETHRLTESEMATHAHPYTDRHWDWLESSDWGAGHAMSSTHVDTSRQTGYTGGIDSNEDGVADTAQAHNNMQPSMVLHFIIKY